MTIGIHGKEFDAGLRSYIQHIFNSVINKGWSLCISEKFMISVEQQQIVAGGDHHVYSNNDDLEGIDLFFSIGGDGTLLETITHIGAREIPILGINTGRLGFLATTAREEFDDAFMKLQSGAYAYDERTLLHLETSNNLFAPLNFALNDVAILKKDTSSMITVHAYINGDFLNSYWSDGLIISTPTGSTGYSISCGGPVVIPGSNNFIITPISPHNLTVRPMIVPDDAELSFTVEGRSKNFLISLDSRYETIEDTIRISICKEKFKAKLIKLEGYSYFRTLRQKLNWGLDARN